MNKQIKLSRRQFLVSTAATTVALSFGGTRSAWAAFTQSEPWTDGIDAKGREFTAWLDMLPDGTFSVKVTTPDVGNGTITQALAFVHEELGARWEDLKAEYAPPLRDLLQPKVYTGDNFALGYFSGRSTAPTKQATYMSVAATARETLKAAAAQMLDVPAAEIEAKDSVLTHAGSGKSLTYAEVYETAKGIEIEPVAPKSREEYTFLEHASPAKVQIPLITKGAATYGIDVKVEGKVYAALKQSPVHGGTLVSINNRDEIMAMKGVREIVTVDATDPATITLQGPFPLMLSNATSAVAVIADHYWQARKALEALDVTWDAGAGAQWESTEQMNEAALAAVREAGQNIEMSVGDVEAEFAKGGTIVEAEYLTPYCEQSCLEPLNGTALVTADRVEMWHPSQHTQQAQYVAADSTGVPLENIHVHQTYVGGGFGRRVFSDDARMVVEVAKKYPGVPVHTVWTREETHRQGRYRPLMAAKMKARLGDDGLPEALLARMSGGPGMFVMGMADTAMTQIIPNVQVESARLPFHVMTGPYRGPGYNSTAFFVEAFIDELAEAAGEDTLDYRIRLYGKFGDPGWVKCLEEVKAKSGWGSELPAGQARGVAIGNWGMGGKPEAGTTVATVVHAEVAPDGKLTIHQVDVAFDTGRVFNKDAVQVEMEGGTIFGLNMALNEELNIRNGEIVEGNFDTYPMLRMANMPKINIHFGGLTDHDRYFEVGEPPVGPVGPALASAIYQITGKRLRTQPLRKHDISWTPAAD